MPSVQLNAKLAQDSTVRYSALNSQNWLVKTMRVELCRCEDEVTAHQQSPGAESRPAGAIVNVKLLLCVYRVDGIIFLNN